MAIAKTPGIAGRDDGDGAALLGERARQPGAGRFVGVVAGVSALPVARPDAVKIRAVPDEVGGRGQFAAALRGHPVGVAGAEADDGDGARGCVPTRGAGQHGEREVRHVAVVDLVGGQHPLLRCARALDVVRVAEPSGRRKRFPHSGIRTPQFQHDGGVGVGKPALELVDGQGARNDRQHLVALHKGSAGGRGRGADRCHPRHDHRVEPLGQPRVHVHVGAVEQRIALGEQCDVAPGIQVRGDALGGLAVEVLHRAGVPAGMVGGLGGHRVDQVLLDLARPQIRLGDAASDAAPVPRAVIGHDVGLRDQPGRLDRHQLGVARAQPDAEQCARGARHSVLLAIALTAAAAIALPPRRPVTTR